MMSYVCYPAWWSQDTAFADTDTDLVATVAEVFVVAVEHATARDWSPATGKSKTRVGFCVGDDARAIKSPDGSSSHCWRVTR